MGSPEDGEGGVPNEQDELYPEEPGLTNYKNTQIQKCTNTKIHKYNIHEERLELCDEPDFLPN